MLNKKKALLFEAGTVELYDYDVARLNRHKTILLRVCRELAAKLEERTKDAVALMQENRELREQIKDLRTCFPLAVGGGR